MPLGNSGGQGGRGDRGVWEGSVESVCAILHGQRDSRLPMAVQDARGSGRPNETFQQGETS